MQIAIHGKAFKNDTAPFIAALFDHLQKKGVDIIVSDLFAEFLEKKHPKHSRYKTFVSKADLGHTDFMISVGGDGTLLETVTYTGELQRPILGINTGRLGFLANVSPEETKASLDAVIAGQYIIDSRALVMSESDHDLFGEINFGLNEFTVSKRDSSSMIVVHTYLNGAFLNTYWADGVIISTPTGSTGYSLSCGGPVLIPGSNTFVISPICPHNLNVRPLIVPDSSEISFEIESRSRNVLVSLDSRSKSVVSSVKLKVKKAPFSAKLISLQHTDFLKTLRNKLNWGFDARN